MFSKLCFLIDFFFLLAWLDSSSKSLLLLQQFFFRLRCIKLVQVKWPAARNIPEVLWYPDYDSEDNLVLHAEMAQHGCWQMQTYSTCTWKPRIDSS